MENRSSNGAFEVTKVSTLNCIDLSSEIQQSVTLLKQVLGFVPSISSISPPPPHTTPHFSGLNFVLKVIIRRFDDSLVFSDAGRMDFDCGFRLGVLGLRILLRDQSRNKSGVHGWGVRSEQAVLRSAAEREDGAFEEREAPRIYSPPWRAPRSWKSSAWCVLSPSLWMLPYVKVPLLSRTNSYVDLLINSICMGSAFINLIPQFYRYIPMEVLFVKLNFIFHDLTNLMWKKCWLVTAVSLHAYASMLNYMLLILWEDSMWVLAWLSQYQVIWESILLYTRKMKIWSGWWLA